MTDLITDELWKGGPRIGKIYEFPQQNFKPVVSSLDTRTLEPVNTGSSVLGLKFNDGVMIAADTCLSYGSLARFRNISRLFKVNDNAIMGASGDFADFQFIKEIVDKRVRKDRFLNDGFSLNGPSLFSWLTRILYNNRTKGNPLWNELVIGGFRDGKPFLGLVNKLGTAFEANSIASGFGSYLAQPLMRDALDSRPDMTEADAKKVIEYCMKVLYLRDARSWNKYEIAILKKDGVVIESPLYVKADWSIAHSVKGYD